VIEHGDYHGARAQGPYSKAKARILAEATGKKIATRAQLEKMRERAGRGENSNSQSFSRGANKVIE